MSWIIGYVGTSLSRDTRERLAAFAAGTRGGNPAGHGTESGDASHAPAQVNRRDHAADDHTYRSCYVAAGGLQATHCSGELPEGRGRWAVVGTGILVDADGCHLLSPDDWRVRLSAERPKLDQLGGAFVALRWTDHVLEVFGDPFGLRAFYWMNLRGALVFSTRMDWLASLANRPQIAWGAFGSHWLTFNQLSHCPLLEGLERLGPAGRVRLTLDGADASSSPFVPTHSDDAPEEVLRRLLKKDGPPELSLGLSGGLDSRLLLALAPGDISTHVFGPDSNPDVRTALQIASHEGVACSHFRTLPPAGPELVEQLRTHATRANAVSFASAALSLRYYGELHAQDKVSVDGAFGELLRRQFMNRLLRRGRGALERREAASALQHISYDRASVFRAEVRRQMLAGAQEDLNDQLEVAARDVRTLAQQVDLINVRTRLPNFFGYEQARLDEVVRSYMPFAHPTAVNAAFALPESMRRGGRYAKRLIRRTAPRLATYPLIKGGFAHPFFLPPAGAAVLGAIRKRISGPQPSEVRDHVLGSLEEFVMDRIHSAAVRRFGPYEVDQIERIALRYYLTGKGGAELDWWLAFDLWREGHGID